MKNMNARNIFHNSIPNFYRTLYKIVIVSALCLVFTLPSLAQQNVSVNIRGKLLNKETGQPLEYVNVFLANTTIGANTGKDGKFIIKNAPPGNYDLIFSCVGFETQKEHIQISENAELNYNISLVPKLLHFNLIDIVGKKEGDWGDNLDLFKDIFLGETDNADETKILNPEVIKFKVDKKANLLKVYADSVLKIENRSLGYMIYVILDSLIYNKSNQGIRFTDYARFQELKAVAKDDSVEWSENRLKTFRNSPRYFFYQLVHRKLYKKEFELYKGTIGDLLNREGTPVNGQELELSVNKDSTVYDLFFSGCLKVRRNSQTSILSFYKSITSVDKFGNFLKPYYTVEIYGYWGKQGIADALPLNYIYSEK